MDAIDADIVRLLRSIGRPAIDNSDLVIQDVPELESRE